MQKFRRTGLLAAGVVLASGLLPFQAFAAAPVSPLQLTPTCDSGANSPSWVGNPVAVQAGQDAAPFCRVKITGVPAEGLKGIKAAFTLSAKTIAMSGYSATQLSRMLQIQTNLDLPTTGGVLAARQWIVNPDGSLTLDIPAFDIMPVSVGGQTVAFGQLNFLTTGSSTLRSALLEAQLTVADGQGGTVASTVSLNYVADGRDVPIGTAGTFKPVTPVRALDTRSGIGATKAPVGQDSSIALQIAGANGIPDKGVTAVVLNVTATNATKGGYVTVYPHGQARPTASNLNFTAGQTIPNLVTVPVIDGKVNLYNFLGTTDLVADISGYYTSDGSGSRFTPKGPNRLLDTRNGTGAAKAPAGQQGTVTLQVAGAGGVPATGVTAVVLNVTATNPSTGGYVTVYPHGQDRPTASNLNFTKGQTIPNLVTVPVVDGKVNLYNFLGTTDLVADVAGYYSATGSVFVPTGPTRVMDTRAGFGSSTLWAGRTTTVAVNSWKNGVPPIGATSVALNVTATQATTGGYVTVFGGKDSKPTASNLNFTKGQTIPNAAVSGADGGVNFFNFAGNVDLVADLSGYFTAN
ncbi:hypothetical protein [Kitasatospora sp. McL0602]|uniref:hypothetical protein n=1 Tax=Kitasatospora sp. McL0602 TaxID=3439530 RepID=UPI003F88A559